MTAMQSALLPLPCCSGFAHCVLTSQCESHQCAEQPSFCIASAHCHPQTPLSLLLADSPQSIANRSPACFSTLSALGTALSSSTALRDPQRHTAVCLNSALSVKEGRSRRKEKKASGLGSPSGSIYGPRHLWGGWSSSTI